MSLSIDGVLWRVHELGVTRTGAPPDAGAPLLLVGFVREAGHEGEAREAFAVARSIEDMSSEALEDLFQRSRVVPARDSDGKHEPPEKPAPRGNRAGR